MCYTNQKVTWETAQSADMYADMPVGQAATIFARKQPKQELIKTSDGRELLSRSVFYVDPKVEERAAQIKRLDRLDGELVEAVYVMCDLANRPKMYRFVTI